MNAEQRYYEAIDQWKMAFDHKVANEIKIRQKAAIRAQKIKDMIEAGVEIEEPVED